MCILINNNNLIYLQNGIIIKILLTRVNDYKELKKKKPKTSHLVLGVHIILT